MPRTPTPRARAAAAAASAFALLMLIAWAFPSAGPSNASAQGGSSLFVRKIALNSNDLVYSPTTKKLYASVPSGAGAGGNTITPIDPATGALGTPVFIGSEPNRLAISDDGVTLYASLDGAFAVRRMNVQTQTPGSQFALGGDNFLGLFVVNDLAVAPGAPDTVAVDRYYRGVSPPEAGVAVFDNGVQRPKAGPGHIEGADFIAFSDTATTLYGGGYYAGLRNMTLDATGVASITKTAFDVGAKIKYAGGLVFSSTGQVINPAGAGSLLGAFSGAGTNAFVPDAAAGRAYYLVGADCCGTTATLKAFDINTFLPLGSQTISGVNGSPTVLVRWGANGLAFRTTSGETYVIQTSLIPSNTAVPTPTPTPAATPTPSPSPAAAFVRTLNVTANSIAYDSARQTLYATIPSTAGSSGNSVAKVNTTTGAIESPVFVGSEPYRMAFSDDGQTMYVGLTGAAAVRRVNLQTQTPGLQFSLGADGFDGPYSPDYLAVMPGNADAVAVSRGYSYYSGDAAAVYDNGVQRQKVAGSGSLQFGLNSTRLYAGGGPVEKLTVAADGLTSAATITVGRSGSTSYFDKTRGLLFTSGGDVLDPETGTILGEFTGLGYNSAMAVDSAAGRVYFMTNDIYNSNWKIVAYDMNTFLPLGFVSLNNVGDTPTDLVRWGANGLAFRTSGFCCSNAGGKVILVQTALVDGSQAVPTPTPTITPTPVPTPAYVPTFVRKVSIPAGDVVYNDATHSLYASVSSAAGSGGNSIVPVNPTTGAVGASVFVGSEPGRLALADDGRTLYTYLEGAKAARRFDVQTMTPGLQFFVGAQAPADMEVMPGSPQTLAVSPGVNFSTGPTLYDDGVARTKYGQGSFYAVLPIEFGATPDVLYGYDSYSSGFELVKFTADATGLSTAGVTNNLITGYSTDIEFANGLLYSSSGRVVDPEAKKLVGTFNGAGGVFTVDAALGRIFFLVGNGFGGQKELRAFDLNTFLPLGSVALPNLTGNPTRMARWGANGLAVRTANSGYSQSDPADGGLFILQSALVSNSQPVPTGLSLSTDRLSFYEYYSTFAVTVARTGDISKSTSVNYATSDGTAKAGSDYTAASGALTFAAGEQTKTFNVTLLPDNVYEGNETFNITLSAPTGGALLAGPSTAVVTLLDDEQRPSVSVGDVMVTEGNAGTTDAQFLVSLSNASVETISVNYATVEGTASSASDFTAASGTLTFAPLSTSALVKVKVKGDYQIESDEAFALNISSPVSASVSRAQGTATIANDDAPGRFQLGSPTYQVAEGGGGFVITVNRVSGLTGTTTINYATADGTATAGSDYTSTSGTLTFDEGESSKTVNVPVADDSASEPDETIHLSLGGATGGALLGVPTSATLTIKDDDKSTFQLGSAFYTANETEGQVTLNVTRTGNTASAAAIDYATADGTATEVKDYTLTLGTLRFAAGETEKQINVLVTNDAFVEPDETFLVNLSATPSGAVGTTATATVTLHSEDASQGPNPSDDATFFVREHYHDFLNREPDTAGLNFWKGQLANCGNPNLEVCRVNVSAAFFQSIEFQQTGYFVYRVHQAAYNRQESLNWRAFLADTQEIGRNVQVGLGDWQGQLEANKRAYVDRFVTSSEWASVFGLMSNAQFVDALNANTLDPLAPGLGGSLTAAERDQLVADLDQSKKTRAEVLRAVAENGEFSHRQTNKAFVLMEYYGYLRRNPNSPPDSDFVGYNFWLGKLDEFHGNFVRAEMVKAFLSADEYRHRFGQ
jgi:hypothetical protein